MDMHQTKFQSCKSGIKKNIGNQFQKNFNNLTKVDYFYSEYMYLKKNLNLPWDKKQELIDSIQQ